ADALDGFTRLAVVSERPELALTIAGAAHAIRDRIGYETPKPWRRRLDQSIGATRAGLNLQAATAAWDRGLKLTEQQAVLLALSSSPQLPSLLGTSPSPLAGEGRGGGLTPRELEIASLVAAGLSNRQIGLRLKISERTA